jgi:hypothetical protein
MALTPEKFAEITAKVEARMKRVKPPGKPKVVASDGEVIRDAKVRVSVDDPNARLGETEVVVRRPEPDWLRHDRVTINMAQAEGQWWDRQQVEARDRQQRQALHAADDMNVWNTHND